MEELGETTPFRRAEEVDPERPLCGPAVSYGPAEFYAFAGGNREARRDRPAAAPSDRGATARATAFRGGRNGAGTGTGGATGTGAGGRRGSRIWAAGQEDDEREEKTHVAP